jgi:hypothetical protein
MEELNERLEIINASDAIRNDIALSGSPSCIACPSLVNDFLKFVLTCSGDTGTEIFHQFQKTLRAEPGTQEPGSGIIRENEKVKMKICFYWVYHYILNTYVWKNVRHSFHHVLTTDFVLPVMKRRSKKPKTPPQQPRARRDTRHSSNNNHSPRNDNRRNIRSPWSNAGNMRSQSSIPLKTITRKKWSVSEQRYI